MWTPLIARVAVLVAVAHSSVLFHITDKRVDEASGIARGVASPRVFYVQNDSGDSARFFALDASSGRVRAEYDVPAATNIDWEDLAVARDARGTPSVWLADIGDNDGVRDEVQLYRVPEPHVDMSRYDVQEQTSTPDVWRLRYPRGHPNAESLAVAPGGAAYVITKSTTGHSVVYAVPRQPDPDRVQVLRRVGAITFHGHGGLVPTALQVLATGAAISRDGSLLAVRTYTDAFVWRVSRHGTMTAALREAPTRVDIPLQPQGEGVGFDGQALVLDSEHVGSAVYRVALAGPSPPQTSTSAPSQQPSAAPSFSSPSQPRATAAGGNDLGWALGGAAVLVIALGGAVWWRRRSRE